MDFYAFPPPVILARNTKTALGLWLLAGILGGCVPKSEWDATQKELAAAQEKIAALERERVPRSDYDAAQSAALLFEEKAAALERALAQTRAQLAAQEKLELERQLAEKIAAAPRPAGLVQGTFEFANGTKVYSPDAVLNFGPNLRVSSSTGLMVSDPQHKIVAGELNLIAKDVVLETPDGLFLTERDGSVTFTGSSLTLKPVKKAEVAPATPLPR
jgi:hypothetical protein